MCLLCKLTRYFFKIIIWDYNFVSLIPKQERKHFHSVFLYPFQELLVLWRYLLLSWKLQIWVQLSQLLMLLQSMGWWSFMTNRYNTIIRLEVTFWQHLSLGLWPCSILGFGDKLWILITALVDMVAVDDDIPEQKRKLCWIGKNTHNFKGFPR